jgi:hypothetical protein
MAALPPMSSSGGGGGNFLSSIGGVGGALGDIGDIAGVVGGLGQNKELGKLFGSAQTGLNDEISQEQSLIGDAQQTGQSAYNFGNELAPAGMNYNTQAAGYAPMISSAGTALTQNPYLSPLAGYASAMAPGQNAGVQGQFGTAQSLSNYNALTPAQMASLTTQAGNAAKSAANTFAQQSGGVANPALLQKQLLSQAGTSGANAAVQLGSQVSQDQLGALEAAGGLYGSGGNLVLSSLEGGAGTIGQAGSEYLTGESGAGSLYEGAGGLLGGIGSTDISGANSAYNASTGAYNTGIGGASDINNQYQQLLKLGQGSAGSGGFGLGSIASLAGLFA